MVNLENPDALPGNVCAEKQVCTGGSQCIEGHCSCPENRRIVNDQCMPGRIADKRWMRLAEAHNSDSSSDSNELLKMKDWTIRNALVSPGEPCSEPEQTCTGNSTCIEGVCRCPKTQILLDKECRSLGTLQIADGMFFDAPLGMHAPLLYY